MGVPMLVCGTLNTTTNTVTPVVLAASQPARTGTTAWLNTAAACPVANAIYVDSDVVIKPFDITTFLNSGQAAGYFSAGFMMVVIAYATGYCLRLVLSMLR